MFIFLMFDEEICKFKILVVEVSKKKKNFWSFMIIYEVMFVIFIVLQKDDEINILKKEVEVLRKQEFIGNFF